MTFTDWLISEYHRIADNYRMYLYLEIKHTKKIYGEELPEDVKIYIKSALKDIKPPEMKRWTGDRTGTMEIYNRTHKPNYAAILNEALQTI